MCVTLCRIMSMTVQILTPSQLNGDAGNKVKTASCGEALPASIQVLTSLAQELEKSTGSVASAVNLWLSGCFSIDRAISVGNLNTLIIGAEDANRDDFDATSANTWAAGYKFPGNFIQSEVRCLREAQLDFTGMVKQRLKELCK